MFEHLKCAKGALQYSGVCIEMGTTCALVIISVEIYVRRFGLTTLSKMKVYDFSHEKR